MTKNKYGLKRGDFKPSQKEYIRKRDGFGCVHCGRGVYTYEHFNPEFKDAKFHDVNGIAVLCGQCQLLTTKGILSKKTIQEDVYNPYCKRQGYQNDFLDLSSPCLIQFGNFEFYADKSTSECGILIVNDELTLSFTNDPVDGPIQLSAIFRDASDNISLKIDKNEWQGSVNNWDIKQTANRIDIYHSKNNLGIGVEVNPPHEIYFTRFTTYFNKNKLWMDKDKFIITNQDGNELTVSTPFKVERAAPIIIRL